ncbi:MAG: hypothetical protein Q7S71_04165 [Candidatus Nitrotoga sp.]|nr:hypothetical protein [Candidatus Nitrotoga sp.]
MQNEHFDLNDTMLRGIKYALTACWLSASLRPKERGIETEDINKSLRFILYIYLYITLEVSI